MADKDEKKDDDDAKKGGGKMKLIIMLLPLIILIAAAVWFFFFRSSGTAGPVTLPEPTPGTVVTLDPITVNLAGSHFLKLGMAIQPTAAAKEVDGSKALDLAISQFSGDTIDDLSSAKGRQEAKDELVARVKLAYLPEGTDFATATQSTPAPSASADTTENGAAGEEVNIATMSGEEAIKLASKLQVQPDVYDVYLTEFVMQ